MPRNAAAAPARRRAQAAISAAGIVAPFAVIAVLWAVAAPGARVVSLGDGSGIPTYGSDGAAVSATLMLSVLLAGAGAAAAVTIWRRMPRRRSVPGALAWWAVIGAVGAATAALAPWCVGVLAGANLSDNAGQVVDLAPRVARQVWPTGTGGTILGHLANAVWSMAGAIVVWFLAAYSSVASDLR